MSFVNNFCKRITPSKSGIRILGGVKPCVNARDVWTDPGNKRYPPLMINGKHEEENSLATCYETFDARCHIHHKLILVGPGIRVPPNFEISFFSRVDERWV